MVVLAYLATETAQELEGS
jgi:hypothetical protein